MKENIYEDYTDGVTDDEFAPFVRNKSTNRERERVEIQFMLLSTISFSLIE